MIARLLTALLIALFIPGMIHHALALQSQDKGRKDAKAQDTPLQLKTELIEIRAVVKDKKGKIVEGLTKEDFEVLENKSPQPLSFFSMIRVGEAGGEARPAAVESRKPVDDHQPQRTVLMFVDTFHMDFVEMSLVQPALKKFLDEQMTDGDLVGIITSTGMLGMMEQFTRNRKTLNMAVERLRPLTGGDLGGSVFKPINADGSKTSPFKSAGEAGSSNNSYMGEVARRYTLGLIESAVKRLADMPGQRLFLYFSPGFSIRDFSPGSNLSSFDSTQIENIVSQAVRSGVVIYSIDSSGLWTDEQPGKPSSIRTEMQNVLTALSYDTGGDFFRNTNDLSWPVKKALDENRLYYALAYYPSLEADNADFRKIKVRVKNHPEYKVRAQRGYSPAALRKKAEKEQSLTSEDRVFKALASPLPVTEIGMIASATVLKAEGEGAAVGLLSYIDGENLDYKQEGQKQGLDLEAYTSVYDFSGKLVHGFKDKVEADLTGARAAQVKQNGLTNVRQVVLKPGLYNVRVGVKEPRTGKMGTAVTWVEVPEVKKTRLAIGGIMVSEQSNVKDKTGKADVGLPSMVGGVPVFKRGNILLFGAMIFANEKGKVAGADLQVQTELLAGGESVYKGPMQPLSAMQTGKTEAGIQIGGQVPLQMPAGMYELRVVVKRANDKRSVTEAVIFRVDS